MSQPSPRCWPLLQSLPPDVRERLASYNGWAYIAARKQWIFIAAAQVGPCSSFSTDALVHLPPSELDVLALAADPGEDYGIKRVTPSHEHRGRKKPQWRAWTDSHAASGDCPMEAALRVLDDM
ncbi:MAG: hypothetical protein V1800_06730 [Candidatus Latescibacterota bacterium]